MKKLFLLLAAAGVILCSCSETGVDDTPIFEFVQNSNLTPQISPAGATLTFDFVSKLDWLASVSDTWISVEPQSGTAEDTSITVAFQPNRTGETRTGTVSITLSSGESYEISMSQESEDVVFAESGNPYKIGFEGGDIVIPISTNVEYTVEIPEVAKEWLTVADTRTLREEKLTFTVAKNDSYNTRTAEVKLLGSEGEILQAFTIEQACESVLDIGDENLYKVGIDGGTIEVKVTTNLDYTVEIPEAAKEWLSLADTRALREETLTFTVTKNEGYDVRQAVIKLLDADGEPLQVFAIEQSCEEVFDADAEAEYTIDAKGGTVEVKVATNIDYTIEIPEEAKPWLRLADTRAYREETLTFVVLENEEFSPRSAVVRLWDADGLPLDKFIIAQTAKMGDPNQIIYSSAGGIVAPTTAVGFGASIVSNVYEKGVGIITFTGDVNAIPDGAFKDAKMLTSITLPDTVLSIGAEAFSGCEALPIFKIPDSVTSIGNYAFSGCTLLTSITIPDGVTSIGGSAFYGCTGELIINNKIVETDYTYDNYPMYNSSDWLYGSKFTKLTIGDNITKIGDYVFHGCTSLTSVTIPDSVTSIGGDAFNGCTSLKDTYVNITDLAAYSTSNPMRNIGGNKHLLVNGTEITELVIPDSVTSIGSDSFYNCTSLTSITIGNSVTSIGGYAFSGCSSLTAFYSKFASADNRCLIVDGVLNSFAPAGLTEYTIPDSVTSIGESAFRYCTSLTSVTIGKGVTSIGYSAFEGCTGELIINSKIIETDYLYDDCPMNHSSGWLYGSKFTKVTIGDDVTSIGNCAFRDCSSLTSITIGNSVTSIGSSAFYNCTGKLTVNCNIPSAAHYNEGAFYGSKFTEVIIGDGVTSIGDGAFWDCTSLKSVNIPDSVTSIGDGAFWDCTSLTSITIPDSVTSIGNYAFSGCTSLTNVTIGKSVTSIGYSAFSGCTSLTSVTIPDSVTEIGEYAFEDCPSLTSVTIGNSVTSIGGSAFYGCSSLTSVTIGNSVTSIGKSAFSGCTSLTSVTIGNSVTSIGGSAFYGCSSLTSVTIGNSVTSIGKSAFSGCTSLTSVTIPDGVTSIGRSAFVDCTSLTSITIPNSVTSIGDYAFSDCTSLKEVYCKPTTPPTGGSYMFSYNASGRKIYVPTASVGAYKATQYWSDYKSYIVGYNF